MYWECSNYGGCGGCGDGGSGGGGGIDGHDCIMRYIYVYATDC